jgi:hypothetical protein
LEGNGHASQIAGRAAGQGNIRKQRDLEKIAGGLEGWR